MTERKPKVALVVVGADDLSGGGGAERQFADAYDMYRARGEQQFDLHFLTDTFSRRCLRAVDRLREDRGVVELPAPAWRRAFRLLPLAFRFAKHLLRSDYDAVHFTLPLVVYMPALFVLRFARRRPVTSVTIADCRLADYLSTKPVPRNRSVVIHTLFFASGPLDGVLAWYEAVARMLVKTRRARRHAFVHAARYCFADVKRFRPAATKERHCVFAGRLSDVKKPLWFVEAVRLIRERDEMKDWRFSIFGKGELETEVRAAIAAAGLSDELPVSHRADMAEEFATSSIFVSTQEYENFTSLSMLEAMASGNAVVARNVGQTAYFVSDGANGILARDDSPEGIARAMVACARDAERLTAMQAESRRIATEVHTADHFLDELESFWAQNLAHHGR